MKTFLRRLEVLVVCMMADQAFAASWATVDGVSWRYNISDGKAIILGAQNYGETVTIPATIEGYPVTEIGESTFYCCYSIKQVILPSGLTSIGYLAFGACTSLSLVSMPDSVKSIGRGAFSGCTSLSRITIPDGVNSIGQGAFNSCTSLLQITIPGSVTNISESTFWGCTNLSYVTLQEGIVSIGENAFRDCAISQKPNGIIIPKSVTRIAQKGLNISTGYIAFLGNCPNLVPWALSSNPSYTMIYVARTSTGFGSKIPGKWTFSKNIDGTPYSETYKIDYLKTAKFNANGGSVSADDRLRVPGTAIGDLPQPSRAGYSFNGWFTAQSGGAKISASTTVSADITYYAHWTANQCTITFDANGGAGGTITTMDYDTQMGELLKPVLDGYTFIGWFTELDGGECITSETLVTGDATYYAHWIVSPYVFGGNANWTAQIDGSWRSGAIENDESSNMEMVHTNGCKVSFKWKCSCEPLVKGKPYDYLSFEIDGVRQDLICGETDWQEKSYEVTGDGEHVFCWIYQKDEEGSAGEDCGWVKQVVVAPRVTLSFDGGEATDGTTPAPLAFYADDDSAALPDCGALALPKHSFAGWSDGVNTYTAGTVVANTTLPKDGTPVLLTAAWTANTLSAPVITAPETYEADSATVTIAAEDGVTVYYTLDGSKPSADGTGCRPYLGPFAIEGSVVIRAIAAKDNYYDSEVASFAVTRATWTFGEYLNCPERSFITGGDADWVRVKNVSDDGYALRSGAIGNSQTSRLEMVVYGAGTVAFRYKVEGEILKRTVYDGLAFCIDGVQQGDLMGENSWTGTSFTVTGDGRHSLSWLYVKDEDGRGDGEDCAWLDNVVWTANDPLPQLDVAATDNDVRAIIAGLSDARLSDEISGTTDYAAFRSWVDGKVLSHSLVKDAPNAWLAYALDSAGLMAKSAALTSEDVVIESFAPSSAAVGAFELVVGIGDAEIGEGARLAEALGVEGAAELDEAAFASDGLSVSLVRTADGKAKTTVTPVGAPPTFFLRAKVK